MSKRLIAAVSMAVIFALIGASSGASIAMYHMRDAVDEATIATAYSCGYVDGYGSAGQKTTGLVMPETGLCKRERSLAREHGFGFAP